MFKTTSNFFEKKKKSINSGKNKSELIKTHLQDYLKSKFGEALKGMVIKIEYDGLKNSLNIITENKVIANEITLIIGELNQNLFSKGIKLDRILIR